MKENWRTTLFGVGAAIFYIGYKVFHGQPIDANDLFLAAGLAGVGTLAKDHNK